MRILIPCLLALPWAAATQYQRVVVYTNEGDPGLSALATIAVDGPELPQDGMIGRLTHWDTDVFGCDEPLSFADSPQFKDLRPIVLIERSTEDSATSCTFEQKVLAAQTAGASAAIIFDYKEENPILMAYGSDAEEEGTVTIPAVFVSHTVGATLMNSVHPGVFPLVMMQAPAPPSWDILAMFEVETFTIGYCILVFLIFPMMVVHIVRMTRRRRLVEMVFTELKRSTDARAAVESKLPAWAKPLPLTMVEVRNTIGFKLYLFAVLTFMCFIIQVLMSQAKLEHMSSHHKKPQPNLENPMFVMDYSLGMVFSSITMAIVITSIVRLLQLCCKCRASQTPPSVPAVVQAEDHCSEGLTKGPYVAVQASDKTDQMVVNTATAVVVPIPQV